MVRAADRRILLGLAAAGIVYYASYALRFPFDFGDEGYLYYVAGAFARGETPYRDVRLFGYLPGLFYVFSPVVGGDGIGLARGVQLVGLVVRALLLYEVTRRLAGRRIALGTAFVGLLVPGPWHKVYVGLLALWVLRSLMAYLERPGPRTCALTGLAVGAAALLRLDVAVVGAALFVAAILLRSLRGKRTGERLSPREAAAGAAAAIAVTLPVVLLLLARGVFSDHCRQWLSFTGLVVRRSAMSIRLPMPSPEALLRFDRAGADAWVYYAVLLVIAVYVLLYLRPDVRWAPREGLSPAIPGLVALWALGGLPQLGFERPDVAHLTQYSHAFLVPAALLTGRALARWRRIAGFLALLLAAALVWKHVAFAQGGSAGVLRHPAHRVVLGNGFAYPAAPGESLRPLLETIVERSAPGDRIAALPFLPGAAFVTRRRLLGREVYLVPHSMTGPEVETGYLEALRSAPPRFVLYQADWSVNGRESGRLSAYAPAVDAFLREHFRVVLRSGGFLLMELRTELRGAP